MYNINQHLEKSHQFFLIVNNNFCIVILNNSSKLYAYWREIQIQQISHKMNMNATNLQEFLKLNVARSPKHVPFKTLSSFITQNRTSIKEIVNLYQLMQNEYKKHYKCFRELVLLLCISIMKASTILYQAALELVENLITHRLWLICIEDENFILEQILGYCDGLISIMIPFTLKNNKQERILDLFTNINIKDQINILSILVQLLLFKHLRKKLSSSSLQELFNLLTSTISKMKYNFIKDIHQQSIRNQLQFQHIVALRANEDKYQTYNLKIQNGTLKKSCSSYQIDKWITQAFTKEPKSISTSPIKTQSIFNIFSFMIKVEIFASSPKIQVFDEYVKDEKFLELFCKFLMGQQFCETKYKFCSAKWKLKFEQLMQSKKQEPKTINSMILEQIKKIFDC